MRTHKNPTRGFHRLLEKGKCLLVVDSAGGFLKVCLRQRHGGAQGSIWHLAHRLGAWQHSCVYQLSSPRAMFSAGFFVYF